VVHKNGNVFLIVLEAGKLQDEDKGTGRFYD
jgi:hypothetical protein